MLGATFAAAWVWRDEVMVGSLRMRQGYAVGYPWDWTVRAGVLGAGLVVALCFVRLVPRRRLPVISYLGSGGLYVYPLHPLVLRPALEWWDVDRVGPWWERAPLPVVALALSVALASPPVRRPERAGAGSPAGGT